MGRSIAVRILAAVLLLAAPLLAHAAGLGRLSVLSSLGQALNAEIEIVSLQPGEEEGLSARLPSGEAFKQAGIEFNPVLIGIRFAIERRDGRPILKLSTTQPVNEPFVDLLVELQWATGRLVREYTFLLDPPEYKGPPPVAAAPVAPAPAPAVQPTPAPVEAKPLAPVTAPAAKPEGTREVKKGDTLGKIARESLPPGITFNQMLIALYRANREAFIRDNINLVRAGRILNIPDRDAVAGIDAQEARRLVQTHAAEFAEYRSKLAGVATPAEAAPGQREVTGRIAAKPDTAPLAAPKDQLKLSKADPAKPSAPAARAARADDLAARDRALKEAQSRVVELEKNVTDLQKLLELKNQSLAELEKKAGVKPAAPVAAPPAAKAPEAPKPAPAKPAAEAPKPAAEAPKPKPKAVPPPPPAPAPEPSIVDDVVSFLSDPVSGGGLAGVLILLLGYGAWAWRKKKVTQTKFQDSVLGAAAGGAGAAALFGAAGEPAAAAEPGAAQPSAGQAAVAPEAEEVDPIAEADVYMAYGRDAQAEEILKESLQKDASRVPVHAKLLEIYANRRDAKAFEQTALKLKGLTGGAGPEWDKAAALGRSIDPQNGLYGGAGQAPTPAPAEAPAAGAALAVDFDLGAAPAAGGGSPDITLETSPQAAAAPALDFDLGATTPAAGAEKSDFAPSGTLIIDSKSAEAASGALDFDLGTGAAPEKKPEPAAPAAETTGSIDFDLNLDLGTPGEAAAAPASGDPKWQEVATKLDLAKAYEEMGDKDGARELLNEVMRDGDAAQKGQAQQMLAKLG